MDAALQSELSGALDFLRVQLDREVEARVPDIIEERAFVQGKIDRLRYVMHKAEIDPQAEEELDRLARELLEHLKQAIEKSRQRLAEVQVIRSALALAGR